MFDRSTEEAREDDATLVKGIRDSLDRLYHHSYTPLSRGQQWEAGCRELDALAARLRVVLKERDEAVAEANSYDREGMSAMQKRLQSELEDVRRSRDVWKESFGDMQAELVKAERVCAARTTVLDAVKADLLRAEEALRFYADKGFGNATAYFADRAALSPKGQQK